MYIFVDICVALLCGWIAVSAFRASTFSFSFTTVAKSEKPALFWGLMFLISLLAIWNSYQVVTALL